MSHPSQQHPPQVGDPRARARAPSAWICSTARSSTSPPRRSAPICTHRASALQWVIGGYALAFAVGLITGGRLGDIYGRRRLFVIGALGFVVASVACAFAV